MLLPALDTPEALFGWLAARGVITATQAREMIHAVRRDMAAEADVAPDPQAGPCPA